VILDVIVSDTSPLRALAHLDLLDLIRQLFGEVLVPPAVVKELGTPPSGLVVVDVQQVPFLRVQAPQNQLKVQRFLKDLDPGEAEALALALEVQAAAVLIDEKAGRAAAQGAGLQPVGTLGILLRAKQRNLISLIAPLMDQLENELDFFLSAEIKAEVRRLAGE
jgi:hypothetical protein